MNDALAWALVPAWVLVLVLTYAVVRLLRATVTVQGRVTALERAVSGLHAALQRGTVGPDSRPAQSVRPAEVLVTLTPDCEPCADLALDLKVFRGLDLGAPMRIIVDDDPAALALVQGLDLPVEKVVAADGTLPSSLPHVLVVGETGDVLATGDPASVRDLSELARRALFA